MRHKKVWKHINANGKCFWQALFETRQEKSRLKQKTSKINMKNSKTIYIIAFTFFALSMIGLFRFSEDVRTVNIVGLFFSGVLSGSALVSLIKRKTLKLSV
jgi:hypothetical protein